MCMGILYLVILLSILLPTVFWLILQEFLYKMIVSENTENFTFSIWMTFVLHHGSIYGFQYYFEKVRVGPLAFSNSKVLNFQTLNIKLAVGQLYMALIMLKCGLHYARYKIRDFNHKRGLYILSNSFSIYMEIVMIFIILSIMYHIY